MVYRGRIGAGPEKRAKMSFRSEIFMSIALQSDMKIIWGSAQEPAPGSRHILGHVVPGYSPTDVLWLVPSPQMC